MTVRATVRGMAQRANPAFATVAVVVPLAAFLLAATVGTTEHHTYVHVMAGILWTGIDLFMAMVIGPVLGGLSVDERAGWFESFTPKMTFLMPTLATVTIFSGITLVLGWVFDAFRDRRWQAFFAIVVLMVYLRWGGF